MDVDQNITFYTAPSGVPSINNEEDAEVSANHCLAHILDNETILKGVEAILVCCYSQHPLVPALRLVLAQSQRQSIVVTGIFEASVATCLQSIDINEKFGIVSTGEQWQAIMDEAVAGLLGSGNSARYAGTETTALSAVELHTTSRAGVDRRMKDATKRLLSRRARAICLGCAGMAGMDRTVREACIEYRGIEDGRRIVIVDGVVSGLNYLQGMLRAKNLERLSAAQS
jgi:Asp/Glu/hydantoin racemase